jgi:chlorophyll synthase
MNNDDSIFTTIRLIRHFLKQMAPLFWGVSILPYYMGWSLASHKIYPTYIAKILLLPDPSPVQNMYHELFILILGIISIGPLLGGATILFNDYCDRKTDFHSIRKKNLPLIGGVIKPKSVYFVSIFLFMLAFILGLFISFWFVILISICIILSISYSSPPIRFKERPGLDFITNAFGSGVICSLAGWILVKPIYEFPILWGLLGFFGVGAIYIPTTIIDYEPDIKEGLRTIATYLDRKKVFYLGLTCVVISNSIIILMGLLNYIITPNFLLFAWPIIIAEILTYWYFLRKLEYSGGYYAILSFSLLVAFGQSLVLLYNANFLYIP